MTSKFMSYVDGADFKTLFIEELGWDQPTAKPLTVEMDTRSFHVTPVAGFHGLHVWACGSLPDRSTQAQIDREVSATSTERLIIFHDEAKQEWRWPRYNKNRGTNMSKLLVHEHTVGSDHSALEQRLQKIALDIEDEITLVQLLERMRTAFDVEESEESSKAAKAMAHLYYELESHLPQVGPEASSNLHKISVTMARVLFLVFADDTMMWDEENLFQNFVAFETTKDGSDLAPKLEQLFAILNQDPKDRSELSGYLARFKYVNGGIFSEAVELPPLSAKMRELLLEACRFDWGNISPAIFGSMFQAVKSKELRRDLGAHYTSERDILKTLGPLFLDELRTEFDRAKSLTNPTRPLRALREKLGQVKVLDPACGCGNFLIVAYRELRELELQVMEALQEHRGDHGIRTLDATLDLKVSLNQIFGIEIDEWPARIAATALHLMDRQCNLRLIEKFGEAPERLPIREAASITIGNALRLRWEDLVTPSEDVVIVGNPPFGGKKPKEQSEDLRLVWGANYYGYLDYVTGWFAKTMTYFGHISGRWAFVSTSSIYQGEPVPYLMKPIKKRGWYIAFAHRGLTWKSEAAGKAGVHVSIAGFRRGGQPPVVPLSTYGEGGDEEETRVLVPHINPYLLDSPHDVYVKDTSKPTSQSLAIVSSGSKPTGQGFIVGPADYYQVASDPVAVRYLRPFLGSDELLYGRDRWCLWLENSTPEELQQSVVLSRVIKEVREARLSSTKAATIRKASTPHLFDENKQPSTPYLAIPGVSSGLREYFPCAYLDPEKIASNKLYIASDPDGFQFGILSSSLFMAWQKAIGGRNRADLNFANTVTWNTFPLPSLITPDERLAVVAAAHAVVKVRERYASSTLAQLYDSKGMPTDLREAHRHLDAAVLHIFGVNQELRTEEERYNLLFKTYKELHPDSQ